jgi:hypothetical protein
VAEVSARTVPAGGVDEAARRVEAALRDLEHLDLNVVVLPRPDDALRDAVDHGRNAAIVAGRRDLLESATRQAREVALRAFSRSGFSGTWAATDMGASVVRAEDRVAAAVAFEAAAMAAVVDDLVDVDTLELLRERTDALRRTTGLKAPGALSNFTSGSGVSSSGIQVALAIVIVIAGAVLGAVAGSLAIGLLAIGAGLALLGLSGRPWTPR